MSTAFTDHIENGKLTKFSDFAKLCAKAFGAAIHMRDKNLDTPYVKREVEPYYKERLSDVENDINALKNNPEDVYKKYKKALSEDINLYKDEIIERNSRKEIVTSLVKEANDWTPPTKEHESFKNFVLEQLKYAEQDVDTFYYERQIEDWQKELDNMTLDKFIEERTHELNGELMRANGDLETQQKNCDESNQWVEELFKSLK